ncbi:MAG: alanine--tRNA ligase [Ilumatobacteraceae bacterium]
MSPQIRSANELRVAFTEFFASKAHTRVPSASLIPHDQTLLFTNAGMVPFKPYFVGDEVPPYRRAVSVQKCARAGGKHNDLDDVGRTKRHLVFFEMMGNFSFGDYFKTDAIPWSWELVTEVFGFDGDQLWVTVHESDDEAEQIWHEQVGVPMNRIQRLGDADNFWQMGETGPCGPCSEIHIDRGQSFGPEGGPLVDRAGDRFLEFWNLVFMQYNQSSDGSRTLLPKPSIDTGAGLERILALIQKKDSVWETDVLFPLVEVAQSLSSKKYIVGDYEDKSSFSLRVLAEHARSAVMLVNDGVFPSNEHRGYVLRRIIRRAIRHAYLLGCEQLVMPRLVETAIQIMMGAYPDLNKNREFILGVLTKEEERFRQTLKTGVAILEDELQSGKALSGKSVFLLHDTYGFPLELTQEIASERKVEVDVDGFEHEMEAQRKRAKAGRKGLEANESLTESYREIMEQFGTTQFVGYTDDESDSRVLAVFDLLDNTSEIFLDITPFYAESGGQVGDRGTISTETGSATVLGTNFALPGLRCHTVRITAGSISPGQMAKAQIDVEARDATRRNHTATHLLHWALRTVLGEHVKQAGSLVAPDRLRFDFSHYAAVSDDEIKQIERIVNNEIVNNASVRSYETTKEEASNLGAIAFFGDKYGDFVRVLEAGRSIELCGGTHVRSTGEIGFVKIVGESSIGSNLRRIEAVTGNNAVLYIQKMAENLIASAALLSAQPLDIVVAVQRELEGKKLLEAEIKTLRSAVTRSKSSGLIADAVNGAVVELVSDVSASDLRELAIDIRSNPKIKVVVLGAVTESGGAALVAAVKVDFGKNAGDLIKDSARAIGGGGGGKGDIATAGGNNPDGLDEALQLARKAIDKVLKH